MPLPNPAQAELLREQAKAFAREKRRAVTFYLPGMFLLRGQRGQYPAVSITSSECALSCDHCKGKILASMMATPSGQSLVELAKRLEERGQQGVLVSGGCDSQGRLPWPVFLDALAAIKAETSLNLSVHSGLVDDDIARAMAGIGVDEVLIDVIGDDETFRDVYHVDFGVERIENAMRAVREAGLKLVPHVVCGLNHGRMQGEADAVDMIARVGAEQVVVVALMPLPGTPMAKAVPPSAQDVATIFAKARLALPMAKLSLGCARPRGNVLLETLALDMGADRMALPSEEAQEHAVKLGLDIRYQTTCCSMSADTSAVSWDEAVKALAPTV